MKLRLPRAPTGPRRKSDAPGRKSDAPGRKSDAPGPKSDAPSCSRNPLRRLARLWRSGQHGQALTETGLLLATLLGGLAVGGLWLMKAHPELINAINSQVRGYYFALSLPFP